MPLWYSEGYPKRLWGFEMDFFRESKTGLDKLAGDMEKAALQRETDKQNEGSAKQWNIAAHEETSKR